MPDVLLLVAAGRYAVVAYVTLATVATTACLTLHAITALDRRALRRRPGGADAHARTERPLFLRLEPGASPAPDGR